MSGHKPKINCRVCRREFVCQICAACAAHHSDLYQPSYTKLHQTSREHAEGLYRTKPLRTRGMEVLGG